MTNQRHKDDSNEDLETKIMKLKDFIGVVILIIIAFFVLTINIIIVPINLARKPIRNFVYRQRRHNKHHETPA